MGICYECMKGVGMKNSAGMILRNIGTATFSTKGTTRLLNVLIKKEYPTSHSYSSNVGQ